MNYNTELFPYSVMVISFIGSHSTPSLWAGTNGGAVFAYMLRLPPLERRMDDQVIAHAGRTQHIPIYKCTI